MYQNRDSYAGNQLQYWGGLDDINIPVYANIYGFNGDIIESNISCVEHESETGIYIGSVPESLWASNGGAMDTDGLYGVRFFNGDDDSLLAQGFLEWDAYHSMEANSKYVQADDTWGKSIQGWDRTHDNLLNQAHINTAIRNASLLIPSSDELPSPL